ncbi:MAG: Ig-like domain-containing protein [Tannerella sp.]|jgi:hypothetical protein|nr:Ig-like domain-containing protein [Tannerella sp.]
MKKTIILRTVILSCIALLTESCSKYERTEVVPSIYVNHMTLRMFAGETVQLQASPTGSAYEWTCEDSEVATVTPSGLVTATGPGATEIVVSDGNVRTRVPLTVITRISMTGMSLSVRSVELTPGAKVAVVALKIPEDANDSGAFLWTTGNIDVATVNSVGDITGVSEGEAVITCRSGNFSETVHVSVAFTRPFKGPHILSSAAPCTLPMVNFDLGGEGYAFHDADTGNSGGLQYRADNGDNASNAVDMENASNPNIGWTSDGEWLQYTVEVRTGGRYRVEVEQASPNSDGSFRLEVNGIDRTGAILASNTGGWGDFGWDTVPALLDLDEGTQKIKYYFVHGAHNIRTLRFTYVP